MVTTGAMPEVLSSPRPRPEALTLLGLLPGARTHLRWTWSGPRTERCAPAGTSRIRAGQRARELWPPSGRARMRAFWWPAASLLRNMRGTAPPSPATGMTQSAGPGSDRTPGPTAVPQPARSPRVHQVTICPGARLPRCSGEVGGLRRRAVAACRDHVRGGQRRPGRLLCSLSGIRSLSGTTAAGTRHAAWLMPVGEHSDRRGRCRRAGRRPAWVVAGWPGSGGLNTRQAETTMGG